MRYLVYALTLGISVPALLLGLAGSDFGWGLLALAGPLALLGTWDLWQPRHNLLRNYPLMAHLRWLLEAIRPQIHQYFIESDTDGRPFDRNERSIVYERAKNAIDKKPFGTELDVYGAEYEWLNHSIGAKAQPSELFRIAIGGPQCAQPYYASVYNISAMSFGSLGAKAVLALNKGAKLGDFAQDTGEGGISRYHREHGGDLIWEIGSGYFGCRRDDGSFDPEVFQAQAREQQVKMIELKLSQGAKPGHGGVLPGAKVTQEIAEARGVAVGQDCISPSYHSAFSTPVELLEFIARLRELAGGKPTGFKLCVGHRWEILAICKAMLETGIVPDFIVVDGTEGGTGAAPLEFSDHVGAPLREGLIFVHNALVGIDMRDKIKIAASGKIVTGFGMAVNMAMGADWCNSARGFMFALGCVQSQKCHTDRCPTGVTTQNPRRQRAIVVPEKAQRVCRFHHHTVAALGDVLAAAGLEHPAELRPWHVQHRISPIEVRTADHVYRFLKHGELLDGVGEPEWRRYWEMADPNSFQPIPGRH